MDFGKETGFDPQEYREVVQRILEEE